ncbi:MAG: hypothetical protein ACK45H_00830 [Bacteroidota bacterium]
MKQLILASVLFSTFTLSAKEVSVSVCSAPETTISSSIDKKKQRRNKKMNKKRKKACANWAKRSYAG